MYIYKYHIYFCRIYTGWTRGPFVLDRIRKIPTYARSILYTLHPIKENLKNSNSDKKKYSIETKSPITKVHTIQKDDIGHIIGRERIVRSEKKSLSLCGIKTKWHANKIWKCVCCESGAAAAVVRKWEYFKLYKAYVTRFDVDAQTHVVMYYRGKINIGIYFLYTRGTVLKKMKRQCENKKKEYPRCSLGLLYYIQFITLGKLLKSFK